MDNPEQFNQLSRIEKLSLVLNPEPDSFVNKDLEMLLYGPMHLRRLKKGNTHIFNFTRILLFSIS